MNNAKQDLWSEGFQRRCADYCLIPDLESPVKISKREKQFFIEDCSREGGVKLNDIE